MRRTLIVGVSDASISAALCLKEITAETRVAGMTPNPCPNFGICGPPFSPGSEVVDWPLMARRTDEEINQHGIDLLRDHTAVSIALDQASALLEQEAAVFLDARPRMQYIEGHIRGALNLPWQEVDRYFIETAERLEGAAMIITYCDGESCDLSHELALFLKEMGFENVRVLVNGWTLWQQAGLPVSVGP